VGGGITGLSAAWFLQRANLDVSYTLLERSGRLGGKIHTDVVRTADDDRFVVEGGPDSFITQKPWALQLARDLGMQDRFLPTNDERRRTFVLNHGRPTPLPDGVLLIVPTKIKPFALSPLISPLGKLRMGLDLVIPPRMDDRDETLADFIMRRLGAEALDKIAEPLLSGIYNAEAERQSIMATFPRFRQIEQKHGSLIKGMLASRRNTASRNGASPSAAAAPSMFVSFRDGMEELVAELGARLSGDCRLGVGVEAIVPREDRYRLQLNDGTSVEADAVILAVPAFVSAQLLRPIARDAAELLDGIRYVSTGTISLAYRAAEFDHPLNGFGVVIPRTEERDVNALTWTSTKFDRRAPEGHVLLRAFFGGSRTQHMMHVDDQELLSKVQREIASIMDVDATPLFHKVYRYFDANPQYDVGHLHRVDAIEQNLPRGLFVTGSPYRGIGIPDCVHQAQLTVETVLTQFVPKAV
jgi:oxygen-dependent protoporphyrinogen oxidase